MKFKNNTDKRIFIIISVLVILIFVIIGFIHIPMITMYIGANLPGEVDKSIDIRLLSGSEYLNWDGIEYVSVGGAYSYNLGKTLIYADDGWSICEVAGDEVHDFVIIRNFLSNYLLVRNDYQIPQSGQVTSVYVNRGKKIDDYLFCEALQKIVFNNSMPYSYFVIEDIYRDAYQIQLCYENCPVGTDSVGYIGNIDGEWVYIQYSDAFAQNENGMIKGKVIDESSITAIEKILSDLY